MVAPDRHLLDVAHGDAGLARQLRHRAVVIEARHRREALARDVGRVLLRDQRVRVGGVADDEHPDVRSGMGIQCLTLRAEDAAVGL